MKIYTKTGDKGETSLFTGQRVHKNDPFIEALGSVDECNSALGTAIAFLTPSPETKPVRQQLETIQHALFDVGAALATPRTRAVNAKLDLTAQSGTGTHTGTGTKASSGGASSAIGHGHGHEKTNCYRD